MLRALWPVAPWGVPRDASLICMKSRDNKNHPKLEPQQAFFAWADAQETGRYEFDGKQPVAIAADTLAHGIILHNLQSALGSRMHASRYRSLPQQCWLKTVGSSIRNPDCLILASPQDPKSHTITAAAVVFEVVSPGTEHTDRIVKVREYAALGSIRRYVMIESAWAGVSLLERAKAGESWRATALGRADVLALGEAGVDIPVAELYEGLILGGDGAEAV